jgi:hypothetical protein
MAAVIVDRSTGGRMARNSYLNFRSVCFAHGIAALTVARFTEENPEPSYQIRRLLKQEFGWRGLPWCVYLYLVDRSVLFSELVMGSSLSLLRLIDRDFKITVKSLKEEHRKRLDQIDPEKDRVSDWF